MKSLQNEFTRLVGIDYPIIGGAMYPCSNPELVAAVSEAGGIGVIQPISMEYVYGYKLRDGIKYIRNLTKKPIGMNVLIEGNSKKYKQRMQDWLDIALEEEIRFFVTALGKPDWVVKKIKPAGGIVFHNTTEFKWGKIAKEAGVDGFIAVNNRAGGHAGSQSPEDLILDLKKLSLPCICAGGVGNKIDFLDALNMGYLGVQVGTRFIASQESKASQAYKQAIVDSDEEDIVLTEHLTGVPVSVINTPYIEKVGTHYSGLMKYLLRHPRFKHYARTLLSIKSFIKLKKSMKQNKISKDYWQAGKSAGHIHQVESISNIIKSWVSD